MAGESPMIELSMAELREICRKPARRFAAGGKRTKALRVIALAAHRAARAAEETGHEAAAGAARAAGHAGASAYLHPLAKATQVLHILGSADHAARAMALDAGDDPEVGAGYIEKARGLAGPVVGSVLLRYPGAPIGGGHAGELLRELDASLRLQAAERESTAG